MLSTWRQARLLLWKGFLIRRRSVAWTVIEIAIPVIVFVFLAAIRTRNFYELAPECHYDAKAMPSAGLLPFLHSHLCSLSNKCKQTPTTGDDRERINEPGGEESIIIEAIRAFVSLLEQMGEKPELYEKLFANAGELIHKVANLNDVPLNNFFNSKEQMESFYRNAFNLTDSQISELDGAGVNTAFFTYLYQEYNKLRNMNKLELFLTSDSSISFLCDRSMLDSAIQRSHGQPLSFTMCSSRMEIYNAFQQDRSIMKSVSTGLKDMISGADKFLNNQTDPFDQFSFEGWEPLITVFNELMSLNGTSLRNKVFCGEMPVSLDQNNPVSGQSDASEFGELKKQMIKFIQKISPAGDHDQVGKCGDIPLKSNYKCPAMPAALVSRLKPLLIGRILVSPDVPIVRDFVENLNIPLRKANLLKDSLRDFTLVSSKLQDSLNKSDIAKAAKALIGLYDMHPASIPEALRPLIAKLRPQLDHWFNDASDPRAPFSMLGNLANSSLIYGECVDFDRFVVIPDEATLEDRALCLSKHDQYLSAIVFMNLTANATEFPPITQYKIRHLSTLVDSTNAVYSNKRVHKSRDRPFIDLKYLTFGFSFLQDAIEREIVQSRTNTTVSTGLYAQQEPYPCVSNDTFNISIFLGLFVLLSWMIPCALLVKNIVHEKEMRLKEMMRIMGLGDAIHWVAWAVQAFTFNLISIIIISLLLKYGKILPDTDLTLLMFLFVLFALCCICQCLLISTLFVRTNIASVTTALLCFLFFFPFQLSVKSKSPTFTFITLLFPQTSMGYGLYMLSLSDQIGEATWANLGEIYLVDYDIALTSVLASFAVDSLIYLVIAWYVSAVFPGKYGVAQPWYFFVTARYWCPQSKQSTQDGENTDFDEDQQSDLLSMNSTFEEEPHNLKLAVSIKDMNKVYGNRTKALDSLTVRFYESQITAFLGHNGAGKTTTMSIITGLYRPTSGNCKIYGMNLHTDMAAIREYLGVCPQHNILFDKLTVEEQLSFYGALKGLAGADLKAEVEAMLVDTGMEEKRNSLASTLSGGMKRKLCIGIAFIGGSKLIILDEPTAGIDAHARRSIWKLLLKYKQDRTMILSTHHMDEADVLADRIAIISEGNLCASGSSLFLKKRFGDGNRLVISKDPKYIQGESSSSVQNSKEGDNSSSSSHKELRTVRPPPNFYNKLIQFIRENTHGEGVFVEDLGPEMVFRIPIGMHAVDMKNLFESLEQRKAEFGVRSYGISAPSLQQIFLKVAPVNEMKLNKAKKNKCASFFSKIQNCCRKSNPSVGLYVDSSPDVAGLVVKDEKSECDEILMAHPAVEMITSAAHLRMRQFRAILTKRLHTSKRSWLSLLAELFLPIALLMAMELYKMISSPQTYSEKIVIGETPLPLVHVVYFNKTHSYIGLMNTNESSIGMRYLNALVDDPGVGIRCANPSPLAEYPYAQCVDGIAKGHLNVTYDQDQNITYNVPDIHCGCSIDDGWNCTIRDYPIKSIPRMIMNTTDMIWDLTYRNISQFRMVGYDWTLSERNIMLGGWTFGHENVQALPKDRIADAQSGVGVLIDGLKNLSNYTSFDWEGATADTNWTAPEDPFNPKGLTFGGLLSQMIPSFDVQENQKVWFNNRAWISLPLLTNSFYNAVYRALIPPDVSPDSVGIFAVNHPMNHTIDSAFDSNATQKMVVFRILVLTLILSLIPASFAMVLIDERTSFSKHLQSVSGIPQWIYWTVNFGYDFGTYLACSVVIMLLYYALDVPMVVSSVASFFCLLLLLVLYGITAILLVYILQLFFTVPSMGFVLIGIGMFFIGTVSTMAIVMIERLMAGDETLELVHTILALVFLVIPQYNLGIAVLRLNMVYQVVDMGKTYLTEIGRPDMIPEMPIPDPLEWQLMGKHLVVLAALSIIYALIIFVLEYRIFVFAIFRRIEKARTKRLVAEMAEGKRSLDEDVLAEQARVEMIKSPEKYGLVVKNLAKSYSLKFLAVNNISFAVERGECFGLLGVNGAGKTTTFSMLTGRLPIGLGDAFIHGEKISNHNLSSFRLFGYCPQFDALNLKLTAKEQLEFYSRIRGIPEDQLQEVVKWAIREMKLTPYANEVSSSYSGGNKRKLSAAIALVADPPVILLDEPSAGMDPSSQQFMWNLILQLRRSKRTTILTSHSMDECEALCTRIAIMVSGQFECIGGLQHLKSKFGKGYTLTMKLHSIDDKHRAEAFIVKHLPHAHFEAAHCTTLFYRIDSTNCTIAQVFDVISKLQEVIAVDDYSLSQTTLDEVFVSFASKTGNGDSNTGSGFGSDGVDVTQKSSDSYSIRSSTPPGDEKV